MKNTKTLLFIRCVLLVFVLCVGFSQLSYAQIGIGTIKKRTVGGVIEGEITVFKGNLSFLKCDHTLNWLTNKLTSNLRVKEYNVQDYTIAANNFQTLGTKPKIELKSEEEDKYVFHYSFGLISTCGINIKDNLTIHRPYFVTIDKICPNGNFWLGFKPFTTSLIVAFLTDCDRTFECYDFTARVEGVN